MIKTGITKNSSRVKIRTLAEFIALEFPERITPLEKIVEVEELRVYYDSYGVGTFDGMTVYDKGNFSIHVNVDNGNKINSTRGRFTLAHELGHYIIDSHRIGLKEGILQAHPSLTNRKQFDEIEREADHFASCLLMPTVQFQKDVLKKKFGFEVIQELSKAYHVSITACAFRFAEIGNHPIMIVYSEDGLVKWTNCSDAFPYYSLLSRPKVPPNTVMGEYFYKNSNTDTSKTEEVWAIDWFGNVKEGSITRKFYEYCLPYKKKALSIIWEK